MAALARAESLDFKDPRDAIQVSDSVLSKQLSNREQAGNVKIKKTFAGMLPRTSASLTPSGREAWAVPAPDCRRCWLEIGVPVTRPWPGSQHSQASRHHAGSCPPGHSGWPAPGCGRHSPGPAPPGPGLSCPAPRPWCTGG
ncbi:hypothetical protein DBZ45_16715 [Arthrobacter globiformis]|uniref:Winged helix DNA-binding domain-containing protein n=1 Tax=Arthrobacter globiformis TaxID=1665 RepID=A0A328HBA8_ARTGO|nr:hypothetical protein DBZ45_16715 [Arthrobacter globiformis]